MIPTLYMFREKDGKFELSLGEFSTLDGLKVLNEKLKVQLVRIGASSYKNYGWATEKEFPIWKTVKDVKTFFEQEGEFDLIDFEIELIEFGSLSTHDDGECHFVFKERKDLIDLAKTVSKNQQVIVAEILNNPEMYIEIDSTGKINRYHSFDQYLKETKIT